LNDIKLETQSDYFSQPLCYFLFERLSVEDYKWVIDRIDEEIQEYCDNCDHADFEPDYEPRINEGYL